MSIQHQKTVIHPFVNQFRHVCVRVTLGTSSSIVPAALLWSEPKAALAQMIGDGVYPSETIQKLRGQIDMTQKFPWEFVVDGPGWQQGRQFVLGDGTVIAPEKDKPLNVEFHVEKEEWAIAGDHATWRKTVGPLLLGQQLARFALALSLAAPLLELSTKSENVTFDFSGDTSSGKSTILDLAGSLWGPTRGTEQRRYSCKWNTTPHALGLLMQRRNGCLLAIDELNSLGQGAPEKAIQAQVKSAIFTLADGTQKASAFNEAPRKYRLLVLSTSNSTLGQALGPQVSAVSGAAAVRMITIPSDGGKQRAFDGVPRGYSNMPTAIDAMNLLMVEQHGTVARKFLQKLVDARAADEVKLKLKIAGLMDKFLSSVGVPVDGPERRVAEWFGLVYAAATLAKEWKVFPLGWGTSYVREIYGRHRAQQPISPTEAALRAILAYSKDQKLPHFDATDPKVGNRRQEALAAGGFIERDPQRGKMLILPRAFAMEPAHSDWLRVAKASGSMVTDGSDSRTLQAKRIIAGRSQRCYVIHLRKVKAKLNALSVEATQRGGRTKQTIRQPSR